MGCLVISTRRCHCVGLGKQGARDLFLRAPDRDVVRRHREGWQIWEIIARFDLGRVA